MAIDLNGLSSRPTPSSPNKISGGSRDGGAEQANQGDSAATTAQTVKLSAEAQSLQRLEEQMAQLPDVDAERVEQIKQAIEDGSYKVDADQIAGKLLALEDQLFG